MDTLSGHAEEPEYATSTSACGKPYSSNDKWIIGVLCGLMFFLFASPEAFKFTNLAFASVNKNLSTWSDGPTVFGMVAHSVAFGAAIRFLIK